MNNEDKILAILEKLQEDFSGMKEDVSSLKQDVSGLKQDVSGLKQDVSGLKQDASGLKEDVSSLKQDVSSIKIRLDVDIQTQLNLLSEGHSRLVERLDILDEVKELAEDTRDKLDVVYHVVRQHSSEITELKKAQ